MNKLLLGRYVNGDSLVHRMDARSKLVLSFYFVAIIFLCNNWQTYLLLAAFVLMCVKFSDLGIGFFIKGVKPLLGLIVFTVLLHFGCAWVQLRVPPRSLHGEGLFIPRFNAITA